MAQVARDEFTSLVDETMAALHAREVPDELDPETARVLHAQLENVHRLATSERLVRVANVARHLQRLLGAIEAEGRSLRHTATVRRGLDVLSLLTQDAERQRHGHPAAALDDAVDCFVEQVERTIRGERGARIMKFPQSRTRSASTDSRVSCPIPPGTV